MARNSRTERHVTQHQRSHERQTRTRLASALTAAIAYRACLTPRFTAVR